MFEKTKMKKSDLVQFLCESISSKFYDLTIF